MIRAGESVTYNLNLPLNLKGKKKYNDCHLVIENFYLLTSPPSSKTKTSPCSKGDIVPASVFK